MKRLLALLMSFLGDKLEDYLTPALIYEGKLYIYCWVKSKVEDPESTLDDFFLGLVAKALEIDPKDCSQDMVQDSLAVSQKCKAVAAQKCAA